MSDAPSSTVPTPPVDPRIKRAHAIIPALQRVKCVPLGGDLLPAALEAIAAIDAMEVEPHTAGDPADQLARIDAILARSEHICEIDDNDDDPITCGWRRDIQNIREVRGA